MVLNSQNKLRRCRSADIPIYAYFTTGLDPKRLKDVILESEIQNVTNMYISEDSMLLW
jgi:hypothetical protein